MIIARDYFMTQPMLKENTKSNKHVFLIGERLRKQKIDRVFHYFAEQRQMKELRISAALETIFRQILKSPRD